MKKKDRGYRLVIVGVWLFLSGICLDVITIIIPVLLPFSSMVIILIVTGIIFVTVGGLTKEEEVRAKSSDDNRSL